MKKIITFLSFALTLNTVNAQEKLKDYLVNSNGESTLRYEWTGKSTQPTNMYTIRTVNVEGNTALIKEVLEFQGRDASETFYTCNLTTNELKTKTIVNNNIMTGRSERIVEQILLKLPAVGQTLKWNFIDEREGTKYTYSIKRTTIDNKKALKLTEVIEGINATAYHYYVLGIGYYKKTMKDSNGEEITMMVLKE